MSCVSKMRVLVAVTSRVIVKRLRRTLRSVGGMALLLETGETAPYVVRCFILCNLKKMFTILQFNTTGTPYNDFCLFEEGATHNKLVLKSVYYHSNGM